MTLTIPPRPAGQLAPGDRIAPGFLPDGEAAEVRYVEPYQLTGEPWALVVCRLHDGYPESHYFRADSPIPLEALADATGANFSDLADRLAGETTAIPAGADVIHLGRDADGHP